MRISDKAGSATPPQSNGHAEPQPELVTPSDVSAPAVTTKQVNQLADRMEQVKFQEIEPRVETLKANMTSLFHLSQREINRPADVLACIGKLVNYEEPNEDYPEEEEEVQEAAPKPEEVKQPQTNERRYHLEKLFTAEKDLRELIDEESECLFFIIPCKFKKTSNDSFVFSKVPPRDAHGLHRDDSASPGGLPAKGANYREDCVQDADRSAVGAGAIDFLRVGFG